MARRLRFTRPDREPGEEISCRKMTLEDTRERVLRGEIVQAATIILVLRACRA